MFSNGAYSKIWGVVNKGAYSEVECSTNKKNAQTQNYETDFSSKFVRFVGTAHKKNPQPGDKVKITNCGVTNVYEKDGQRVYQKSPTFLVFDFEREVNAPNVSAGHYTPSAYGGNGAVFEDIPLPTDGDLPF